MLQFIIRNIAVRKSRTFLTVLGITIGIGMIVTLVSVSEGLDAQSSKAFEQFERVTVTSDKFGGKLPYSYVEDIEDIPGVTLANPSVSYFPAKINEKDLLDDLTSGIFVTVMGYEPDKLKRSPSYTYDDNIVTGRFLETGDQTGAVVGKSFAEAFDLHYRSSFDIDDEKFQVVGIYETGLSFTESVVIVPLATAQTLAEIDSATVNSIGVDVEHKGDINKVAKRISYNMGGVDVTTPEEAKTQFGELESTLRNVTWVIASVAAIVGGIGVLNAMVMNVMERRREIGILKAVGWTKGEVLRVFLLESILIGLLGGVVGILLGQAGVFIIGELLPALPAEVTMKLVLQAMGFAVLLGALGGLYPAWRAASVDPIEALKHA